MKFKIRSDAERRIHINMDMLNVYASRWKPGTVFEVELVRRVKKRSDPMRRYYFGIVLPTFMEHLGYEPEDQMTFHRQLKIIYFSVQPDHYGIYRNKDIPAVFGNDSEIGIGIKQKFVEWIKRKAAVEGCYIPDPGE